MFFHFWWGSSSEVPAASSSPGHGEVTSWSGQMALLFGSWDGCGCHWCSWMGSCRGRFPHCGGWLGGNGQESGQRHVPQLAIVEGTWVSHVLLGDRPAVPLCRQLEKIGNPSLPPQWLPSLCPAYFPHVIVVGCGLWSAQVASASLIAAVHIASASQIAVAQWALTSLMALAVWASFWWKAVSVSDTCFLQWASMDALVVSSCPMALFISPCSQSTLSERVPTVCPRMSLGLWGGRDTGHLRSFWHQGQRGWMADWDGIMSGVAAHGDTCWEVATSLGAAKTGLSSLSGSSALNGWWSTQGHWCWSPWGSVPWDWAGRCPAPPEIRALEAQWPYW